MNMWAYQMGFPTFSHKDQGQDAAGDDGRRRNDGQDQVNLFLARTS